MGEIEYKNAEENPWYWLSYLGAETWNRWAITYMSDNLLNEYNLSHIKPLTDEEKDKINAFIREKIKAKKKYNDYFEYFSFIRSINFHHLSFGENENVIIFKDFIFPIDCNFQNSTFKKMTTFENALFIVPPNFFYTTFEETVIFDVAKWKSMSSFRNCKFKEDVSFKHAEFLTFYFINSTFNSLPDFSGTNGNITIRPEQLSHIKPQYYDIRKWAKLKNAMNKLHLHREEADFFAKELECRALEADWEEKVLITIYRATSDFGRSAGLPLGALVYLFILFIALYEFAFFLPDGSLKHSAHLSLEATLPFIPKEAALIPDLERFNDFTVIEKFLIRAVQGFQFILSTILLFLIGLGIRNRLRIK